MFTIKNINKKGGFTLIELLIVIAIIGVLAATVVVSLGSQTDKAKEGSAKISVSSIRNLATIAVVEGTGDVCNGIFDQVSGEKGNWNWNATTHCTAGQTVASTDSGKICCASSGTKWAIWSALPDADGRNANDSNDTNNADVYCADSSGFAGEVYLTKAETAKTLSAASGAVEQCEE